MTEKKKTIEEILDEIFTPEVNREMDEWIERARQHKAKLQEYMLREHGVDLEAEMEKDGLDPKGIQFWKDVGYDKFMKHPYAEDAPAQD